MRRLVLWVLTALKIFTGLSASDTPNGEQLPRISIPGNISIGGLVTIRLPDKTGECSIINSVLGIEVLEALLFSVDRINADKTLLPDITLGVRAFDTCGSEDAALDRAVKEFVLGDSWKLRGESCTKYERPVVGVIGPAFSYESEHVTPFLNLFEVPIISYSATSPELSDKSKFEYFSRTVPSDTLQTQAIIDFLIHFNWTYVSVLYTDESYGRNGYEWLKKEAEKKGICFGNRERKVPLIYEEKVYKNIIRDVVSENMANVIVLFCVEAALDPLLKELQKQSGNKELQLVGTDSLGNIINQEKDELEDFAKQAIFFHSPVATVEEFNDYFLNLTPQTNTRNPWFKDFYQEAMDCTFGENTNEPTASRKACSLNQTLRTANYTTFLGKFSMMPLVIDGVYAFAEALNDIHRKRCGDGNNNTCIPLNEISGKELLDTIRANRFDSPSGHTVKFTSTGDVTGVYDIYYSGGVSHKAYKNVKVGEWRGHGIHLSSSEWKQNFVPTRSCCSSSCGVNQIRQMILYMPDCCWKCIDCPLEAFAVNETTCEQCPKGFLPDEGFRTCIKIKASYFSLDGKCVSLYLVSFPIFVSALGITCLVLTAFVFVRFRTTPLVKASGRELSCLLLVGLFFLFLFPFVAILKPSTLNCLCKFILSSLPTTVCYVAIIVKNNRIFRIFNPERNLTTKPSFVRPKSQIVISLGLISFQVLLLLALMLRDFPHDQLLYPSSTKVHHVCVSSLTRTLVSHVYNTILLIVCTYYAYKTRNIPRNFNEAKYIAFAMYGLCVSSLAFSLISLLTSARINEIHKTAITCFRMTLTATIILVCFFIPKIYIIVWKSQTNIKHGIVGESFTGSSTKENNEMGKSRQYNEGASCAGIEVVGVKKIQSSHSRSTQTV